MPPRRRTDPDEGAAALSRVLAAPEPARTDIATAVRYLLEELADRAPGRSVEVGVPPYGGVQCVSGPRHMRGTPPTVVETDAATWLELALGRLTWREAEAAGRVTASGQRSDLSPYLPLIAEP